MERKRERGGERKEEGERNEMREGEERGGAKKERGR